MGRWNKLIRSQLEPRFPNLNLPTQPESSPMSPAVARKVNDLESYEPHQGPGSVDEQDSSHDAGGVRKELGSLAGEEVAVWKAGVAVSTKKKKRKEKMLILENSPALVLRMVYLEKRTF